MQVNLMDYNNTTNKVKMGRAYASLQEDTPARIAYYKDMTEKPTKKTKGGQRPTWHDVITRDLNTIDINLHKPIKLSKHRLI